MANNIAQLSSASLTPQTVSAISQLEGWAVHRPIPDGLTNEILSTALVELEARCLPVTRDRFGKTLAYLFAHGLTIVAQVGDMPDPIDLYFAQLAEYPAAVVARACKAVVRAHKWATPVLVAEIVEHAETDLEWRRVKAQRQKLAIAKWRAEVLERDQTESARRHAARLEAPRVVPMPRIQRMPADISDRDLEARRARVLRECEQLIAQDAVS